MVEDRAADLQNLSMPTRPDSWQKAMAPLNVTPMTLSEMVKKLVDPPQKKQLEQLQEAYARGQVPKEDFTTAIAQIAGKETLTKALRIMVPGYDEMCGNTEPEAPAPTAPSLASAAAPSSSSSSAQPQLTPEQQQQQQVENKGLEKLKKGFLSGGSIESKGGDAPYVKEVPKPKEVGTTLDGVDVVSMREQYYQHMQEAVPLMDENSRDHLLHNNFLMHDAKSADNGGNVILDKGGRARVMTDDSMGGEAEGYRWGQNESELTIKVAGLPAGLKGKDVSLTTTSKSIKLLVQGAPVCVGSLYLPILSDESTFVVEDDKESGGSTRLLIVTLTKRDKTGGKAHWPCIVHGAPKIDVEKFGVQVLTADPNKPHELVESMKAMQFGTAPQLT